jgi:hypothetical protein
MIKSSSHGRISGNNRTNGTPKTAITAQLIWEKVAVSLGGVSPRKQKRYGFTTNFVYNKKFLRN